MTPQESPMKIKALAPWFGAKRNLAPRIVQMLGPHSVYWEPFCGSMAVLLSKPSCRMETVNDLHGDLINLARVIQDDKLAPQLYDRLHRTLMCESLYEDAAKRYSVRGYSTETNGADLERAYEWFCCIWQGISGLAGTRDARLGLALRFTSKGGHAATRWAASVDSIPAWHERLRKVVIVNQDAFEWLERIEDERHSVIYVDPPYFDKGAKYIHDFVSEDHERLAKLLYRFKKARVVLSYYDHPKLQELYPDWYQEKIEISKALSHQGRRGQNDVRAVEVLLCNQPIEARQGQMAMFGEKT